jgi:hypothetical protein
MSMDLHKKEIFWRSFLGYFLLPRPRNLGSINPCFIPIVGGWGRGGGGSICFRQQSLLCIVCYTWRSLSTPAHTLKKKLHFAEHFLSLLAKENHKVEKDMSFFPIF